MCFFSSFRNFRVHGKQESLKSAVKLLNPFVTTAAEMYERIKSDDRYSDVTFKTIKRLFNII